MTARALVPALLDPRLLAPALVTALALTGAACDIKVGDKGVSVGIVRGRAMDEWTRTYMLPAAGGTIEVVNVNGGIDVEGAPMPTATAASVPNIGGVQVVVTAQREARASSDEAAQDLLKRV